jgi:quinol monooxygenase YgiN
LIGISRPPVPPGPIVSLVYRVADDRREQLFSFLERAFDTCEKPEGVRMVLYESIDEPGLFFEVVAYANDEAYEADQHRLEHDPEMRAILDEWRRLLEAPPEVRRMRPILTSRNRS